MKQAHENSEVQLHPRNIFKGHNHVVTGVSADSVNGFCTGSYDGSVKRYDVESGDLIHTFTTPVGSSASVVTSVLCVGPYLLVSYRDKKVKKFLLRTGKALYVIDKAHTCSVCCMSATNDIFATGSSDGIARVFNLEDGGMLRSIQTGSPVSAILLTEGLTLFTGGDDGGIKKWKLEDCSMEQEFYGHSMSITALATNGEFLWSGSKDAVARQWSLKDTECIRILAQEGKVGGIVIDGDRVFIAADNTVRERSITTNRPGVILKAHRSQITSMCTSGDGNLFTGAEDCTACHWVV